MEMLPARLRKAITQATKMAGLDKSAFNVIKLEGDPTVRISLLSYQSFDAKPFPALLKSCSVDLVTKTHSIRDYTQSKNPPILHRKELLLPPEDARRSSFEELTKTLEQKGLFVDARRIGFRRNWDKRLTDAGIEIRDHQIVDLGSRNIESSAAEVERHRTAISRQNLSVPMQLLAQHGFLDEDKSIFDYGCGRGNDLDVLAAAGLNACGWDPHYAPQNPLSPATAVNIGYVLNVIEDLAERRQALCRAFELATEVLAVSVMLVGKGDTSSHRPYRDGHLTSRDTFQKYYKQDEAQAFIQKTLNDEAIPVAPGVFFIFSDKIAEQRFLAGRHRRRRDISHLLTLSPPNASDTTAESQVLIDENRDLIDMIWRRALELGRLPQTDELPEDIASSVVEQIGSVRSAIQLAQQAHEPRALVEARQARVEDLTIYYALNQFSRRQKYRELPSELQRDIKAFFGTHARAETTGRELLFSLRNRSLIQSACLEAAERDLGHLLGEHSLQLHADLIDQLPTILRIYVGAAEQLYGSIGIMSADLIKIHMQSSKLTLLRYDDFVGSSLPRLAERIKIDMSRLAVDYFTYADISRRPFLLEKSVYLKNDPAYAAQRAFEVKLLSLLPRAPDGAEPDTSEVIAAAELAGMQI
jgi:DNA phosphorothioation-associated putative methyltransferase